MASVVMGTLAIAYGSVPLYKMVVTNEPPFSLVVTKRYI